MTTATETTTRPDSIKTRLQCSACEANYKTNGPAMKHLGAKHDGAAEMEVWEINFTKMTRRRVN